jgi:hypothetical protein
VIDIIIIAGCLTLLFGFVCGAALMVIQDLRELDDE